MSYFERFSATTSRERWLTEMAFDVRYRDTTVMPARFRDRLRQAWRDLGSGSETLEARALCLLRGKHRLDWTQERYAVCVHCRARRPKLDLVIKNVLA